MGLVAAVSKKVQQLHITPQDEGQSQADIHHILAFLETVLLH